MTPTSKSALPEDLLQADETTRSTLYATVVQKAAKVSRASSPAHYALLMLGVYRMAAAKSPGLMGSFALVGLYLLAIVLGGVAVAMGYG